MVSHFIFVFHLACFILTTNTYIVSGQGLISDSDRQEILDHIQAASKQCGQGKDATLLNDATACIDGYNSLQQGGQGGGAAPSKEAHISALNRFIDCLDPYKKLLLTCTAARTRDDDLTALDLFKSLLQNDGALYNELEQKFSTISKVIRPDDCPSETTPLNTTSVFGSCMSELGVNSIVAEIVFEEKSVLNNLCQLGSGFRTCLNRVKTANIGTPCEAYMEGTTGVALEIFNTLVASEEDQDVVSRCFAIRSA